MVHEDGINETIDYISKKNRYAVFMGDGIECITPDDPRYDAQNKPSFPIDEMNTLQKLVNPIRKKHLTWLIGNHEWKVLRSCGNLALSICNNLEIEYGTFSSKISIYDEHGMMYRLFISHGDGSINSRAKEALRRTMMMKENLKSKLFLLAGDCHIQAIGHTHKLFVYSPKEQNGLYLTGETRLTQHYELPEIPTEGFIHPDYRWYVNSGSYLKLFGGDDIKPQSGYAERKMLAPVELGFTVIKVRDRKIVDIEVRTV